VSTVASSVASYILLSAVNEPVTVKAEMFAVVVLTEERL